MKGRKDVGLNAVVDEPDLHMIVDAPDRSSIIEDRDDLYFNEQDDEFSSKDSGYRFRLDNGRELVKLYTLICDSQNPVETFILDCKSELVTEQNIVLFIEFGLMNGYIKKNPTFKPTSKKSPSKHNK